MLTKSTVRSKKLGSAIFSDQQLKFDITHYTMRSFAIKFAAQPIEENKQLALALPYNQDVVSFDRNRADGDFENRQSYPAELFPASFGERRGFV